jgi:predicted Zn-dependent peptidase
LLAGLARQRWEKLLPELARNPVYVRHDAYTLPGVFVMGATVDTLLAGKALAAAKEVVQSLMNSPATADELAVLKTTAISQLNEELAKPDGIAGAWLDNDTYGLPSVAEQGRTLNSITSADLQRAANRLFRDAAFASVVVGNSEGLKAQLERAGKVEVMGEVAPKASDVINKPQTKSPVKP